MDGFPGPKGPNGELSEGTPAPGPPGPAGIFLDVIAVDFFTIY
jgi:hypothetical protein